MLVGIDFDNTVVCYDELFHRVAVERRLIPSGLPVTKDAVRDYFRRQGQEDVWTALQGYVYGARIQEAAPFPGVQDLLHRCKQQNVQVSIISHKTRYPFAGPSYDLHSTAHQWLETHGFYQTDQTGLSRDRVFFEESKQGKLDRILQIKCSYFIDDLPEFLEEAGFPSNVQRILFDPNGAHVCSHRFGRAGSWAEINELILGRERDEVLPAGVYNAVARLLATAGLGSEFRLVPIPGGANNQVFRAEANGSRGLLKLYFQHPDDPRDRLVTEFGISRFAWEQGMRCLPQPLAADPANRLGLYEYIDGLSLIGKDVSPAVLAQALEFYRALNRSKHAPGASSLPRASEACFSLTEHLRCVERRVHRLNTVQADSPTSSQAAQFAQSELSVVWARIAASMRRKAHERGIDLEAKLPECDRCLSPSDFGFHNTIAATDGRLRFIDLEYAGWDDPAKLVCDFFCQPAVPVPYEYLDWFAGSVTECLSEPDWHRVRIDLLLPVYQLKWCCILLNEFLPIDGKRRRFAAVDDFEGRKVVQLGKAREALKRLAG